MVGLHEMYDPDYANVTPQVKYIVYDVHMGREGWSLTRSKNADFFTGNRFCTYKLKDGKKISGRLRNIQSCTTAPRVMYTVEDNSNEKPVCLEGRLIGSPGNLGVALMDVKNIT